MNNLTAKSFIITSTLKMNRSKILGIFLTELNLYNRCIRSFMKLVVSVKYDIKTFLFETNDKIFIFFFASYWHGWWKRLFVTKSKAAIFRQKTLMITVSINKSLPIISYLFSYLNWWKAITNEKQFTFYARKDEFSRSIRNMLHLQLYSLLSLSWFHL